MTADLDQLKTQLLTADMVVRAAAAEQLAQTATANNVNAEWIVTVHDYLWRPIGGLGDDAIEHNGTDPRNNVPSATIKIKGESNLIPVFMNCRQTMVGVTFETGGLRFPFYVDTFDYECDEKGEWTGTAHLLGIWDVLSYLQIWPDWLSPIQAQLFSYAVFIGPIVTCIENMIAEQALRIQLGINEFVNNALSGNPDLRAWFGNLLQGNPSIKQRLKTPVYVVRTDPISDTSMLIARTVRMESCGTVVKDITRAYGIDVGVALWLPGDDQPDAWVTLTQPTYVVTVKDRTQITGPTGTIVDSVVRTVVDFAGSLFDSSYSPIIKSSTQIQGLPTGLYVAPSLGVNWTAPWALLIAPEPGQKGSVYKCKISDHTPKGWQHIIGGRSPKWLNDFLNATFAYVIDAIMIVVGFTGLPSDLLSGFLNNSFLAFQLIEHYARRAQVGPYHPAIEVFHATASAPYNVETVFGFINAFWDSRGWTCAQVTFRNGEVYTLGVDIFRSALVSVAYLGRTKILTDYVENVMWRVDKNTRDIMVQVGDGKAKESPLAKDQRLLTGLAEAINTLTLAPQSS
jgi:hypothetical protein